MRRKERRWKTMCPGLSLGGDKMGIEQTGMPQNGDSERRFGPESSADTEERPITIMTPDDLFDGLDLYPFVKFVWHSQKAKDEWEERVQRARRLHDRVEFEMVARGHRRAATLHLSPRYFEHQVEQIHKAGLVWLPIQRTRNYSGFSHKHFPTTGDDPNSSVYGVLARTIEDAEEFRRASSYMTTTPTDHETIGELLGFPSCCRAFFTEVWPTFFDPMWQAAERTAGAKLVRERTLEVRGSYLNVQLLRYAGFRVTSHLTCSLDCEASKEIGRIWEQVGFDIDPEGAQALKEILTMPIRWSVLHGIVQVETPIFTVVTNSMPTKQKWEILFLADESDGRHDPLIQIGDRLVKASRRVIR